MRISSSISSVSLKLSFAVPGGFVNEGERVEEAAKREAKEETSLGFPLRYACPWSMELLGFSHNADKKREPFFISHLFFYRMCVLVGRGIMCDGESICLHDDNNPSSQPELVPKLSTILSGGSNNDNRIDHIFIH
jgi:ADP-ribose pyrophosphatase YjhB (NUDIX family)